VFADRKFAVIRELQDNKKILMMRVSQLVAGSAASPQYSLKLSRLIIIVSCSDPRFAAVVQELRAVAHVLLRRFHDR
jgi:hypothetical protein